MFFCFYVLTNKKPFLKIVANKPYLVKKITLLLDFILMIKQRDDKMCNILRCLEIKKKKKYILELKGNAHLHKNVEAKVKSQEPLIFMCNFMFIWDRLKHLSS